MHCGFSNVQALNKVFREKRQMTPTEFREQWTKRKKREEEDWKETVRQDLQKTEWFYEMIRFGSTRQDKVKAGCRRSGSGRSISVPCTGLGR